MKQMRNPMAAAVGVAARSAHTRRANPALKMSGIVSGQRGSPSLMAANGGARAPATRRGPVTQSNPLDCAWSLDFGMTLRQRSNSTSRPFSCPAVIYNQMLEHSQHGITAGAVLHLVRIEEEGTIQAPAKQFRVSSRLRTIFSLAFAATALAS